MTHVESAKKMSSEELVDELVQAVVRRETPSGVRYGGKWQLYQNMSVAYTNELKNRLSEYSLQGHHDFRHLLMYACEEYENKLLKILETGKASETFMDHLDRCRGRNNDGTGCGAALVNAFQETTSDFQLLVLRWRSDLAKT